MTRGEQGPGFRSSDGLWAQAIEDGDWQYAAELSDNNDASREAPLPPNRTPDVMFEDEGEGVTEAWGEAIPETPTDELTE